MAPKGTENRQRGEWYDQSCDVGNDHGRFGGKVGLAETRVHDGGPSLKREVGIDRPKP